MTNKELPKKISYRSEYHGLDQTFCAREGCTALCTRRAIPKYSGNRPISMSGFEDCNDYKA